MAEQRPEAVNAVGEMVTPHGILDPSLVRLAEQQERSGIEAIRACRNHSPSTVERCDCWLEARNFCYDVWRREGKESPLGWRCDQIFDLLDRAQRLAKKNDVYQEVSDWKGPVFNDGLTALQWHEKKFQENN